MPFWCGPAVDHEQGGWMGWLSNDLQPDRTQPKGLIITTRLLWTFSAVHRVRNEGVYHDMADRALDFVMNRFWDTEYGGAFWQIDDTGRVEDDNKKFTARLSTFTRCRNITSPSTLRGHWRARRNCSSCWKATRTMPKTAATLKAAGATGLKPDRKRASARRIGRLKNP